MWGLVCCHCDGLDVVGVDEVLADVGEGCPPVGGGVEVVGEASTDPGAAVVEGGWEAGVGVVVAGSDGGEGDPELFPGWFGDGRVGAGEGPGGWCVGEELVEGLGVVIARGVFDRDVEIAGWSRGVGGVGGDDPVGKVGVIDGSDDEGTLRVVGWDHDRYRGEDATVIGPKSGRVGESGEDTSELITHSDKRFGAVRTVTDRLLGTPDRGHESGNSPQSGDLIDVVEVVDTENSESGEGGLEQRRGPGPGGGGAT